MIDHIVLKFGEAPNAEPLVIRPGAMTVLVGPNNSGKSLTLREIAQFVANFREHKNSEEWDNHFKVVSSITPVMPTPGKLRDSLLAEVERDIAPFKVALGAAKLQPKQLIDNFDGSQIGGILAQLNQYGQLRRLAEEQKIDPSLLRFDADALKTQPTLVRVAIEFLRQVIAYLERNEQVFDQITDPAVNANAVGLLEAGAVHISGYLHHFKDHTILLDGKSRLQLTDPENTHSLHEEPKTMMMRLFQSPEDLKRLRVHVYEAFDRHLALDATSMTTCQFVLAREDPGDHERSFGSLAALEYFKAAEPVSELSDGVKSYIGLHATLLSRDDRIILLDEPEAFLHPPLARLLGHNLTMLAAERGATIIAATHSPFFLMGCIEARQTTSVVRLGYRNSVPTARSLSSVELRRIMNDPLLRSTGLLNALFHQHVIVCEGDSDQAFYQEVNERLRIEGAVFKKPDVHSRDCLFINGHSKQNVPKLLGTLRRMGIPSAGIVDLDLLKDKGVVNDLLREGGAADGLCISMGQLRGEIYKSFEAQARANSSSDDDLKERTSSLIKDGGIKNLTQESDRNTLRHLLRTLAEHGAFVPEGGETESWLLEHGQDAKKKRWLEEVFSGLGSLSDVETYVRPSNGDAWEFVRNIVKWLESNSVIVPRAGQERRESDGSPTKEAAQLDSASDGASHRG